ncbi:uncharacterized protein LOC131997889 [Stomoxys calcitrans]|uniref:uncharacterized protein LOC131997889 n=1 Tax=Stomoxys calcitrans TaxID=35570 RepID=UPI0027E2CA5D|nr:uncharacterized protein LOC131997889 [Stomoxys calcitrans]
MHIHSQGKSTVTALYELVAYIKGSHAIKENAMVAFLYIEGVFNKIAANIPLDVIYRRQIEMLVEKMKIISLMYKFDNLIFYRTPDAVYEPPLDTTKLLADNSMLHNRVGDILSACIFAGGFNLPIMTFSISPWDYVNDTQSIPNLGKMLTNRNLAAVILNDIFNTEVKEFVSNSLGASLETKLIFLLIGHELTEVPSFVRLEKLKRFFRWCWSKNILNVVLLFQQQHVQGDDVKFLHMEIYTYTPFPQPITLLAMTSRNPWQYYVDRTLDVQGYEFKTPVFHDKPSVFKAKNSYDGSEQVTGISGHIYTAFVDKINAKFTEVETSEDNHMAMMEFENSLLVARNIDIGIHPFSYLLPNKYHGSYPITNTNSCVLVPVIHEIFTGLYIPLTLNLNMWILLLLMFVLFQLGYFLIDVFHYGRWDAWSSISSTLRGILNMSLGELLDNPRLPSKRKILVHMLVIVWGMLISQLHIAALTSLLSATIYGKQLDTLDDLRSANVSIMLLDYMFHIYNYMDLIPMSFQSNLMITDVDTVSQHLNSLNTSYAYVIYNEEWKVLERLQMNLWKPRFRIAEKLCIPNIYLSWPMQFNSPFYHPLKDFILRIRETGLNLKWTDTILTYIRKTSVANVTTLENLERPVPLTFSHLTVMWSVWFIGMSFALVAFLCELHMEKRTKCREKKRLQKKLKK